ncbi:putative sterigmatocystin biosynthesis P450 monooxygenase stcS [Madurella mycetomatis]|uniref:Sterigmatocystin biosynthesis P450 monooxygenase stcS n=1 Tax=Madurella mycetomatis TaxID=100816 RepID=A0A175VU76_9PEZI|nr:putative sterigmatocystin biosynthesis P450 monooxygenase stcS [Madurella mycetomatis]
MSKLADAFWLAAAAVGAALVYFALRLSARRRSYRDLPKPPHSALWGHLKLMGEYMDKVAPGNYLQAAIAQMKQDFDLPDVFYLDLWPFGPEFIVCSSADAAALPTTATPFPQSSVVEQFFAGTLGPSFIESTNGALWKELHQMLAPGLTPSAVRSYHQLIVDEAKLFHDRLRQFAASGDTFDMHGELGKYPFEVIWQIFFGERLDTQSRGSHLYEDSRRLNDVAGFTMSSNNPIAKWRASRELKELVRKIDVAVEERLRSRFAILGAEKNLPTRTTAGTLLDRMLLSHVQNGLPLDERLIKLVKENAKGFLVAGYGTTSDTSSYVFMFLGAFPEVLRKLREEHDRVFDKDFDKTLELLRQDPGRIKALEYTTAVIYETLRLFPVGMVCRAPPPGMTSFEYKGKHYPLQDRQFAIISYVMHYDPSNFDEPKEFKPERFLGDAAHSRNAFRPFERGLRSCMGQTLAMDEMKIMLLMTARWFDFELRDHNPVKEPRLGHTKLDTILGDHAFQTVRFTAGPTGEVRMRVRSARAAN